MEREKGADEGERREKISGLMMMEMSFYLSAFGLFTTGRIVRMWMKKTVNGEIRKFHCHFFVRFKWSSMANTNAIMMLD